MKPAPPQTPQQQQECHLDELGYCFVKRCIETIEARGLDDQGLYRIGGVNSRVARLLQMCLDRKNFNQTTNRVNMPDFSDPVDWETKTVTSALKNYLRNLSEPLMTYNLHPSIIEAAKIENRETRTSKIRNLIQQLPAGNFNLLKILVEHLRNVANHSQKNLMTISNLGICFAPTLMRGPDENSLSIMEIKYSNVVASTLIEEYDSIFNDPRMFRPPRQLSNLNNSHQQIQPQHQIYQNQIQSNHNTHMQSSNNNGLINSNSNSINNKPVKCQNGSNDLAQFALKSTNDHTSLPTTTFISNNPILNVDIRPINDIKTYSFDQALMVPTESSYHYQFQTNLQQQQQILHQQQQQNQIQQHHHLSGSVNNSLNFIGYPNSQTSSHPNSLNYSSNSLNNGNLNDQYNNSNQMPYYSLDTNKLPYRSGTAITLYACMADTESELTFGPNEIITDVRLSAEVGWLVGTLRRSGQRGLLPENYVKFI